jgi:PTS system nitrogen regulatory IIA component
MHLTELLSLQRVIVDTDGTVISSKDSALSLLASLIAPALATDADAVLRLLAAREKLQSTGIGDGVAIPHASAESASAQAGALLLCPHGVPFESVDGFPAKIVFGVVGPRRATGEHLRTLARISRLLRDSATRTRLIEAPSAEAALSIVAQQDSSL